MIMVNKTAEERHLYDWAVMPDAHFASTIILCNELLPTLNKFYSGNLFPDLGLFGDHPSYELFKPIIYNMRHAIELYLKYFARAIDKDLFQATHNYPCLKGAIMHYFDKNELWGKALPIMDKYYFGNYADMDLNVGDLKNTRERYPNKSSVGMKLSSANVEEVKQDAINLQKILRKIKINL